MPATRREFFRTTAISAVALSASTYIGAADKPNDRVRVAVMGTRVRGKQLIPVFNAQPYRTGRTLNFDAATETFKDDPAANHLLSREYRKGFELPAV